VADDSVLLAHEAVSMNNRIPTFLDNVASVSRDETADLMNQEERHAVRCGKYGGQKNIHRVSVRKSGENRQRGRLRHRWKDNIIKDLK
jgi:hypothetical protein